MKLQFLTMADCIDCQKGKKIIEEIKPDFPGLEIEEINMTTSEGQEMVQKYQIIPFLWSL